MAYTLQNFETLAAETAERIMESGESWTTFLSAAARLYKYTFAEQLLIYAQRPDATACASYEVWNDRMRRFVKRGALGIALIDENRKPHGLRYVFDIADTGTTARSIDPFVWTIGAADTARVGQALADQFGVSRTNDLAEQIVQIAEQRTNEFWNENRFDILSACSGTALERNAAVSASVRFRQIASASAGYTVLLRGGIDPKKYYRLSDFAGIGDFDNESLQSMLGESVNTSAGAILRCIENIQKQAEAERRLQQKESEENNNERDHLHANRGVSVSEHRHEGETSAEIRQVRGPTPAVSSGTPQSAVDEYVDQRQSESALGGRRSDSEGTSGPADAESGEGSGSNGAFETNGSDEMGGLDEQLQSTSGRNHLSGADLPVTESPSDDEPESGQLTFEWLSTDEQEQSGAGMPRFNADAFEKLIPHEMRFKEADLVNGNEVYWVTQEPFTLEQLKTFQQAVRYYTGEITKFYVTYRGLSYGYNFVEDLANKVLAVVTPLQILDDDYIRAMQDEGLDDFLKQEDPKQEEPVVTSTEPVTKAENVPFSEPYRSYSGIKHDNPDGIVLFQVGDFFEMYGKDAEVAAEMLGLRLISRAISANERVPMCGVPAHSLETYVDKLRDRGYDVVLASFEDGHYTARTLRATGAETPESKNGQTVEGGPKAKYRANVAAIRLLKTLEADEAQATPDQQTVLSRYVGWGGLPDAFDETKEDWRNEFNELRELLTPEEYVAARSSTLTAFYTPSSVIRAIYDAVGSLGFTSGNILEPAMGVGTFFGMLPEQMRESRLYGVELDSITGRIAKQLYPKAHITVAGFETTDRRDFFDLAVGNVPFGRYTVNDKAYNNLGFPIHDYFFAKTLGQVRPGGLIAFVTSRFTMDKATPKVRQYIAERAELLGAIRLPNNTFPATAGTDVVSDILFLQKREQAIVLDDEPSWVGLGKTADGFTMNAYFVEHPEMVLGRLAYRSTQYGKDELTVLPIEGVDLSEQLQTAIQNIHGTYRDAEITDIDEQSGSAETMPADPDVKNYSFTIVNGEVYFRVDSVMRKESRSPTETARIKALIQLRETVSELLNIQLDADATDAELHRKQAELNAQYDAFTKKFGRIGGQSNQRAFSDDASYYLLASLEETDENNKFVRKADLFTKRTVRTRQVVTHVDTAIEALGVSIGERAGVDMAYMGELTGMTEQELAEELRGVVFMDFDRTSSGSYTWRTADDFLSGNVREKLAYYQYALEILPEGASHLREIADNVEALKAVQPRDLDTSEIEVRLGATWVDKDYVQQFMEETFEIPLNLHRFIRILYSPYTTEWQIDGKNVLGAHDVMTNVTYGTSRANACRLLEDALNLRDTRIYDIYIDPDGKERRILNRDATTLAQQKQQLIRDKFKSWIWQDPDRRQTLVEKYNQEMNSIRPREYDGSNIVFVGMNPEITLREHQYNAVARILYGGNALLAHEVGAGKTYEMVAAAMESKRLGLCGKSLFVVPNHLIGQWASEFLRLYPGANILVANKKDFEPARRMKFCARIATGDYDAVIIGQTMFERIPVSAERQERLLREQIDDITEGIKSISEHDRDSRFTIKQMERTRKVLTTRLEKLQADDKKDRVVTFEQLGVDRLFIDESDYYKNLFLYTKMNNVAGLSTADAQKSSDLFMKCRYMDEITGGKGVIFATGTPVSNSMTEVYTIQRYLQYDLLERMGMAHFDCWASRFGETVTSLELAPEGTGYRPRTRFAHFFNLPELMNIFKEVADIKTADDLHLPTPEVVYHTDVAQPTETQKAFMQKLSERATKIHNGGVDPRNDNMLKITSDGRKLGLDQRLVDPRNPDEAGSKVNLCVENIFRYWKESEAEKLTQLVFCDVSTPSEGGKSEGFTIYEDIRRKLVERGVPREQVAFVHEATTEKRKESLFEKVRNGDVRVLIGSTAKMGAGTNVQNRLIASHDLDCPWRPRDLTQREGRIRRVGNMNKIVHVHRYVTEGTFDAYLWQTVEHKQKFISQIMTSKSPARTCEDVDETALSFAEIKALCAGDPRIKERMELDVDVSRLKLLKANYQSNLYRMQDQLFKHLPKAKALELERIQRIEDDLQVLGDQSPSDGFAGMILMGKPYTDRESAGQALLRICEELKAGPPEQIGTFRTMTLKVLRDPYTHEVDLTASGRATYRTVLGDSARGNIIRIENLLASVPEKLQAERDALADLEKQEQSMREEIAQPFAQEQELADKTARLIALDIELNLTRAESAGAVADAIGDVAETQQPPLARRSLHI